MSACLVCEVEIRVGSLCRQHSLALATCDDITAEQIICRAAGTPEAWLIDQWGSTHPLTSPTIVGRATADCDASVLHPSVSVLHAQLERRGDRWRVIDRGSLNGTSVNGKDVRSAELTAGDRLRFGSVSFFFSIGSLPAVTSQGSTGRTQRSSLEDLSLDATLHTQEGDIALVQRPGGGVVRGADDRSLDLAQLEFDLLANLVRARAQNADPDLAFVTSSTLANELEFKARRADGDNVRELVRRVRRKLRAAGFGDLIQSQQRVGYRVGVDVSVASSR